MKTIIECPGRQMVALLFSLALTISSCKKFEHGTTITFKSVETLLCHNKWAMKNYLIDGVDSVSNIGTDTIRFLKSQIPWDGTVKGRWCTAAYDNGANRNSVVIVGDTICTSNRNIVFHRVDSEHLLLEFKITKLNKNQLWLELTSYPDYFHNTGTHHIYNQI